MDYLLKSKIIYSNHILHCIKQISPFEINLIGFRFLCNLLQLLITKFTLVIRELVYPHTEIHIKYQYYQDNLILAAISTMIILRV